MSLEEEINSLTTAIAQLTNAIMSAQATGDEVVTIDVITPTHADYVTEFAKFSIPKTRKTRKDKGTKNPDYPAVTYSRCCGAEGRKKSKFDGKCFSCR